MKGSRINKIFIQYESPRKPRILFPRAVSAYLLGHNNAAARAQKASTISLRSRAPMSMPNPPMACLLNLVAKFFGPSSSRPEGGPRGCLTGWLAILWLTITWGTGMGEGAGRPMPRPSYSFLVASSRGDKGESLEEDECEVVGDESETPDLADEPVDDASSTSCSPSLMSEPASPTATAMGSVRSMLNRKG